MYASKSAGLDPKPVSEQDQGMQPFPPLPQENSGAQAKSNQGHVPSRSWTTRGLGLLVTL